MHIFANVWQNNIFLVRLYKRWFVLNTVSWRDLILALDESWRSASRSDCWTLRRMSAGLTDFPQKCMDVMLKTRSVTPIFQPICWLYYRNWVLHAIQSFPQGASKIWNACSCSNSVHLIRNLTGSIQPVTGCLYQVITKALNSSSDISRSHRSDCITVFCDVTPFNLVYV